MNRLQKILIFTFIALQVFDLVSTLYAFSLSNFIYEVNPLFAFVNDRTIPSFTFFIFAKASVIYWLFTGFWFVSNKVNKSPKYRKALQLILNISVSLGIIFMAYVALNNIAVILQVI